MFLKSVDGKEIHTEADLTAVRGNSEIEVKYLSSTFNNGVDLCPLSSPRRFLQQTGKYYLD